MLLFPRAVDSSSVPPQNVFAQQLLFRAKRCPPGVTGTFGEFGFVAEQEVPYHGLPRSFFSFYLAFLADFAGADDIITILAEEREPGDIERTP